MAGAEGVQGVHLFACFFGRGFSRFVVFRLPAEGLEGGGDGRCHFLEEGDLGFGDRLAVDGGGGDAGDYVKGAGEGIPEDTFADEGFCELGEGPGRGGLVEGLLPEPAELALDGVAAAEGDEGPGR